MRTYSHFFITALADDQIKQKMPVHTKGFLLGSVLPDIPLFFLSIGYIVYYRWINPAGTQGFFSRFDQHFFNDPLWIIPHNFFHAPFILFAMLIVGYLGMRREKKWASFLFWFAVGCTIHTTIDIFTHNNDGPLLLFPFNWKYRFASPVSYWDPHHFGGAFTVFEYALDLAILLYFGVKRLRKSRLDESVVK